MAVRTCERLELQKAVKDSLDDSTAKHFKPTLTLLRTQLVLLWVEMRSWHITSAGAPEFTQTLLFIDIPNIVWKVFGICQSLNANLQSVGEEITRFCRGLKGANCTWLKCACAFSPRGFAGYGRWLQVASGGVTGIVGVWGSEIPSDWRKLGVFDKEERKLELETTLWLKPVMLNVPRWPDTKMLVGRTTWNAYNCSLRQCAQIKSCSLNGKGR